MSKASSKSYEKDKQKVIDRSSKFRKSNPPKYQYSALKSRCSTYNIEFAIDFNEFLNIKKDNKCHYCGDGLPPFGWGIDRKDSSKGYTTENCVPCCKVCNIMKNTLSYKDFFKKIKDIINYRKGC